jgi:hypothetical protein
MKPLDGNLYIGQQTMLVIAVQSPAGRFLTFCQVGVYYATTLLLQLAPGAANSRGEGGPHQRA